MILNINCQSVLKIFGAFASILDSIGCDVVTGTESWQKNNIKDNDVFPPGHTIYHRDREKGQRGGGVFIAINKDLGSTRYQLCRNVV